LPERWRTSREKFTPNLPDVVAEVWELFERYETVLETLGWKVVAAHVSTVSDTPFWKIPKAAVA
jgi:hypothetical protein